MNYQRAVSIARSILVLLCISLLVTVAVFGLNIGSVQMGGAFEKDTITLGLDLAGGSSITYQAVTQDTGDKLATGMKSVLQVIRQRLDSQGLTEANAYLVGDNKITVEIPSVTDPDKAAATLMATANLTFKDSAGNIILTGSDVNSAESHYGQIDEGGTSEYYVLLKFTDAGTAKFAEATKIAANATKSEEQIIYIYMDENVISSPKVNQDADIRAKGIDGGTCVISGSFNQESADVLAGQINAGALKYTLENADQHTIDATLGKKSLDMAILAGIISFIIIILFLIAVYRVPGLMASIALIAYMAIFMISLVLTKSNLTLPGIAGMVLSMGMAVDANVVIFERIKDELRLGKSVKSAIKTGHHRALAAVTDSNVTVIIAGAVLYFLGSGTIKGFAITLIIGNIIAMFTAIYIARWLLDLSVDMGFSNIRLYGVKKEDVKNA